MYTGQWNELREEVLGKENLARIAFEKKLNTHINMTNGILCESPRSVATTVEAILGAVHLEGGDVALGRVMYRLQLDRHVYLEEVSFSCSLCFLYV